MKEKIVFKQIRDSYQVVSLENRIYPGIGKVIDAKELESYLMEAKIQKNLTVKIT
jgi:hypothetical protein